MKICFYAQSAGLHRANAIRPYNPIKILIYERGLDGPLAFLTALRVRALTLG